MITDIMAEQFERLGYRLGDRVPIRINNRSFKFPFVKTFDDVPARRPLLYVDSRGRIAVPMRRSGNGGYMISAARAPPTWPSWGSRRTLSKLC